MPISEVFEGNPKFRRRWVVWMMASIVVIGYLVLSEISTWPVTTALSLNAENEISISVFRVFDSWLEFGLLFPSQEKNCERGIDLGSWSSSQERDGFLMLTPGAEVKIATSIALLPSVEYEALPVTTDAPYCKNNNFRNMTSNISVDPGKYHWPPPSSTPHIRLRSGFNTIRFHISAVGDPIVGESVNLIVLAPLRLKSVQGPFVFFALGLLWPVFIFVQATWAICLIIFNRKRMNSIPI